MALVDMADILAFANNNAVQHNQIRKVLTEVLGAVPEVRQVQEGVVEGDPNLGNLLEDLGTGLLPNGRVEHPLLRPNHETEVQWWPGGKGVKITQNGSWFEIPATPDGNYRQVYGVADNLDQVLDYFKPEIEAPDHFYVIGYCHIRHMPRKNGPYIGTRTDVVEDDGYNPGTEGEFLLYHLYELNPYHFQEQ